jgi:hypothetical protein
MDVQAVMMQNVRLVEAARIIGEMRKTSTVEEGTSNKNNRIPSKIIFGVVGSVAREQVLAMLKTKEDEKVAASTAFDAKKDQTKENKAIDTTALVTTGFDILKIL